MRSRPWYWRADWLPLLAMAGIVGLGLPYLRSAAGDAEFTRQLQWLGVGALVLAVTAAVDYRLWLRVAWPLYGMAVALLAFVLTQAPTKGARSWIKLGAFNIQPTEAFKFALILVVARVLSRTDRPHTAGGLLLPFALTLAPMAMILQQPDLGSALTLWAPLFAMVFASGARAKHLAAVMGAGLVSVIPLWQFGMKEYQKDRVRAFWDPVHSGLNEAFQAKMSLLAIGAGGLMGRGLHQGTLNTLNMLPERHNDFIFAVIAEEGGLMRAGALLGLYALFALSGFRIATHTPEPGGRLLAVGVAVMVAGQAFLNVAVVTVLLPTTGITLPWVSYGGSSLVATTAMAGVLFNVSMADPGVVWSESFLGRDRRRGEL